KYSGFGVAVDRLGTRARLSGKLRAPRELDERRPHDAVTDAVAAPKLRDHRVFRMLERLLVTDRLVALGVEALADRVDGLEPVRGERLLQLAPAQLDALQPRLIDALPPVTQRLVKVTHTGAQPVDTL